MSNANSRLNLPQELPACHALLQQQSGLLQQQNYLLEQHELTIDELTQQRQQLQQELEEVRLQLAELVQRAFAKRSERYIENPNQLQLDFGDCDDAADAAAGLRDAVDEAEVEQTIPEHQRRRPRKPRRENLPENLPRYEVEAEVTAEVKTCATHGERQLIGYDTTETLEFEPPKLRVRVTKYGKFVCAGCETCGVQSPPRRLSLVEGDRYDSSVAAEIITGKYGYHLPIYRQQDYFAGSGWTPSRSTLLNILQASATLLRPLVASFRTDIFSSGLLGTDDTPVTLLLPKTIPKAIASDLKSQRIHEVLSAAAAEGKTSVRARMWAYRGMTVPLQVFDFTVSHHRDGPDQFLEDFEGLLLGDCYSGYQKINVRSDGAIERAACVAHARRKVFEARDVYPREASWLLAQFQQLYDIEDRAKGMSPQARLQLRQGEAAPLWDGIEAWLQGPAVDILPKGKFGEALGYLRNHAEPLRRYLGDGRVPIDNNEVEQLMKQVALGRKNWLFVGSVAAGERAADLLSVVSSAVRNDLDVWAYVKNVLDQLLSGSTDYGALRPDVWKQSHPEAVRHYRHQERRDRADRKQRRRGQRRRSKRR